jgi:hypothetical protein
LLEYGILISNVASEAAIVKQIPLKTAKQVKRIRTGAEQIGKIILCTGTNAAADLVYPGAGTD